MIGSVIPYMTLHKPPRAVYITFRGLATKLATFAISASKHGGRLVNEFPIYSEDFTVSPEYFNGWSRIFQNDCCHLWTEILSRTRDQGSQES